MQAPFIKIRGLDEKTFRPDLSRLVDIVQIVAHPLAFLSSQKHQVKDTSALYDKRLQYYAVSDPITIPHPPPTMKRMITPADGLKQIKAGTDAGELFKEQPSSH
ncbi:hypothetical protein JOB18_021340 [Solea senegalensis]|uniref:Uncharacterized protein n=1 Tax=Solea senegalensis TaxID=28829 RepID=A0AAV6R550_SOLSE|nr:hypothetical protein JOB18_021340 [Solea senegalensis]